MQKKIAGNICEILCDSMGDGKEPARRNDVVLRNNHLLASSFRVNLLFAGDRVESPKGFKPRVVVDPFEVKACYFLEYDRDPKLSNLPASARAGMLRFVNALHRACDERLRNLRKDAQRLQAGRNNLVLVEEWIRRLGGATTQTSPTEVVLRAKPKEPHQLEAAPRNATGATLVEYVFTTFKKALENENDFGKDWYNRAGNTMKYDTDHSDDEHESADLLSEDAARELDEDANLLQPISEAARTRIYDLLTERPGDKFVLATHGKFYIKQD